MYIVGREVKERGIGRGVHLIQVWMFPIRTTLSLEHSLGKDGERGGRG